MSYFKQPIQQFDFAICFLILIFVILLISINFFSSIQPIDQPFQLQILPPQYILVTLTALESVLPVHILPHSLNVLLHVNSIANEFSVAAVLNTKLALFSQRIFFNSHQQAILLLSDQLNVVELDFS